MAAQGRIANAVESGKAVSWHIGRQGEVAGGMTQVVNGYLGWKFNDFDMRVIVSRDGGKGLRAVRLFLSALWQVFTLHAPQRNMVVVHLSQGGSFIREGVLLWLAHRRGFGTVAHMHGSRFVAFASRRPRLVQAVLRAATRVIVLSEATGAAVCRFVPAGRVSLVPNAVPAGRLVAKERLVVFGGSVSKRKGVDVLLQAWQRLALPEGWRLLIAGPVADVQCPEPPVPGVEFLGSVAHADLMGLLERAAVAVLPSRDEAMPMFILEALARRCCVVSTEVGGIPAVLSGDRGVLVPPGQVEPLQAALQRVLQDDTDRQRVADKGWHAFEAEFSAAAVYPRVEHVWGEALQNREQEA